MDHKVLGKMAVILHKSLEESDSIPVDAKVIMHTAIVDHLCGHHEAFNMLQILHYKGLITYNSDHTIHKGPRYSAMEHIIKLLLETPDANNRETADK